MLESKPLRGQIARAGIRAERPGRLVTPLNVRLPRIWSPTMGYQDRALKAACKKCQREAAWGWQGDQTEPPDSWLCQCNWRNFLIKFGSGGLAATRALSCTGREGQVSCCNRPLNRSIAENLNSPRSLMAIKPGDSEPRNCSNASRNQVAICSEISSICRIGICSRAFLRSVSTAKSRPPECFARFANRIPGQL